MNRIVMSNQIRSVTVEFRSRLECKFNLTLKLLVNFNNLIPSATDLPLLSLIGLC